MKELKLGKVKTKEIAEWFGITYGSYHNSKKKKIQELKQYCSFEEVYGGIIINNIYIKEYIKPTPTYQFVKSVLDKHWHNSLLDTAARVGSEIYHMHYKELEGLKESTIKAYAAKARQEKYGRVYHKNEHGTDGSCHPEPVQDNLWEESIPLTEEQYELYRECLREAYYDESDAILEDAMATGAISEAEYRDIKKDQEKNQKTIRELKHQKMVALCMEKIGFYPNQITKLDPGIYFE